MKRTILFSVALPALVSGLALLSIEKKRATPFHSEHEYQMFEGKFEAAPAFSGLHVSNLLPIDSNILFPTAKLCGGCHGFDPNGHALVTTSGIDVNIYDDWRSTMMANAARDPFWRAKVSHESLVNPSHAVVLQDKCTSCHAPAGHYQAKLHDGATYYTLDDMLGDTLGLDGVNCQACHAQAPGDNGSLHSGALNFDVDHIRVAYGPYEMPFAPPMRDFVGITPLFGEHIFDSGTCAGCHTLITNSVDLGGQLTGETFIEQATYHEWLNSRYDNDHDQVSCQSCHMQRLNDEIIISANYQFLTPKFPFALHELAGANVSMLKLMKDNRETLEIDAAAEHFDSTIAATYRMLQEKTLDISLTSGVTHGDTAYFALQLNNKAGHKFPSGYPSRRAWIELVVTTTTGDTVFHSGKIAADGRLPQEDANFEPHHQVVNQPDQVQIYEIVPGDVNHQFTNVLERGHLALKDNRLTPQGFHLSDPAYDTTQIVGALDDPDFNRSADGVEGSGSDIVYYHIPVNGYTGQYHVSAKVWYQTLPPKWMDPIFEFSSPHIDAFKAMYDAADLAPTLVASASLENVSVSPVGARPLAGVNRIAITPTATSDGKVTITGVDESNLVTVNVWNMKGRLIATGRGRQVVLPAEPGVYLIEIVTRQGKKTFKAVKL